MTIRWWGNGLGCLASLLVAVASVAAPTSVGGEGPPPGSDTVVVDDQLAGADVLGLRRNQPVPNPATRFAGIIPVTPGRVLDTRNGVGAPVGPVQENSSIELSVLGQYGVPRSGVDAVVLNVTVTAPTAWSYITVWPTGSERPETSSLNMTAGLTVPNLVVAKVGAGGRVSLFNRFGSTHLLADVVGYSTSPEHLQSLVPARILDTRTGVGAPPAPVQENSTIDVSVLGRGGVPSSGVGSVIVNVTVTQPTADSYVTVWPTGFPLPEASSLNMSPGETRPNLVVAKVGAGGKISLFNRFGSTHLLGDVVGWIPEHGAYTPINPTRILDTRTGVGSYGTPFRDPTFGVNILRPGVFDGQVGPGKTIAVTLNGAADVPTDATALVLNVTAVNATESTFITSWPYGQPMPTASSINVTPGDTAPNMVIVERGGANEWANGEEYFNLFNAFGEVDLIADIVGFYVPWNAQDAPDATANTVHLVIATPADAAATISDAGAVQTALAAEQWLQTQAGRGLRFDTDQGAIEVSRLVFGGARVQLQAAVDEYGEPTPVFDEVVVGGFTSSAKKYVVYVEGVSAGALGWGELGGSISLVLGDSSDINTAQTPLSLYPQVVMHEVFHTAGAVPPCAPHALGSHVSDPYDLMNATNMDPEKTVLDIGRDDYWRQGGGGCGVDVSLNAVFD